MKKFWTKEIKIAITAICCIALLWGGIQFLKGMNIFGNTHSYTVKFESVDGLMVSSPVTVDGYKIGVVYDMKYDYANNSGVEVMINVDKNLRIPKGSVISVEKGLLGGSSVVIKIDKNSQEYYKEGDVIPGVKGNDLMQQVGDMIPVINGAVVELDSILYSVQGLVSDPSLEAAIQNLDDITIELNKMLRSVNGVVSNDVPMLVDNLESITNNVDSLTYSLNNLPIEESIANLNATLENIKEATAALSSTDNTAGLLLNDTELYEQLNNTIKSLELLINDIKENPKKYINVKVF